MRRILLFCIMAFVLTGCLETTSNYNYKVSTKPYTIAGETYYPMATADGFRETGIASWYGPSFHGKKTASGEIYNKYAYTAAHKTLPFGTRVRVKNLDNGETTYVVINDRGPFKSGRIIDLSYSAAQDINMVRSGTARVQIKAVGRTNSGAVVSSGKSTVSSKSSKTGNNQTVNVSGTGLYGVPPNQSGESVSRGGTYYVQVGVFSVENNAQKVAKQLSNKGYSYKIRQHNGKCFVVAGPYDTRAHAVNVRDDLRNTYSGAFIVE